MMSISHLLPINLQLTIRGNKEKPMVQLIIVAIIHIAAHQAIGVLLQGVAECGVEEECIVSKASNSAHSLRTLNKTISQVIANRVIDICSETTYSAETSCTLQAM